MVDGHVAVCIGTDSFVILVGKGDGFPFCQFLLDDAVFFVIGIVNHPVAVLVVPCGQAVCGVVGIYKTISRFVGNFCQVACTVVGVGDGVTVRQGNGADAVFPIQCNGKTLAAGGYDTGQAVIYVVGKFRTVACTIGECGQHAVSVKDMFFVCICIFNDISVVFCGQGKVCACRGSIGVSIFNKGHDAACAGEP